MQSRGGTRAAIAHGQIVGPLDLSQLFGLDGLLGNDQSGVQTKVHPLATRTVPRGRDFVQPRSSAPTYWLLIHCTQS